MSITNALIPAEGTMSATGNQDDFDFGNTSLLRCDNSSLVTLRGLAPGRPGQQLTIVSVGTGQVDLSSQDTNSAASNRIATGITGKISLSAGTGRCSLTYDGTTARWRTTHHVQGAWIAVPFAAGDFTGSGSMTWTVASSDVVQFTYLINGNVMMIQWYIAATSSVGGTLGADLIIALPGGVTIPTNQGANAVGWAVNNGTQVLTHIGVGASGIRNTIVPTANWAASTSATGLRGQVVLTLG